MQCNQTFLEAFEQVYDSQLDEYINSLEDGEIHIFSAKHEKRMEKLIKRQRKPYFKLISTAGRRAVCAAAALVIVFTSAMSVKAFREFLFGLENTESTSGYDVLQAESSDLSGAAKTIEEEYYISALPEGFEETKRTNDGWLNITYQRGDEIIEFEQYPSSGFKIYIDNEHRQMSKHIGSDNTAYYIYTDKNSVMYYWNNGKYAFSLFVSGVDGNSYKNEGLKLCKSIKIKK